MHDGKTQTHLQVRREYLDSGKTTEYLRPNWDKILAEKGRSGVGHTWKGLPGKRGRDATSSDTGGEGKVNMKRHIEVEGKEDAGAHMSEARMLSGKCSICGG